MNNNLLNMFDKAEKSPEFIPKLRQLILNLAVSGKLVPRKAKDESSSELIKKIKAEKENLIKKGKIHKNKDLSPISPDEIPSVYENNGQFERLANVTIIKKGLTGIQNAKPGKYPLIVTAEERSSCDHFDFEGSAVIIPMVSSAGHGKASLKRIHYQEGGKFAVGNILCAAFPISEELISARFLYEYLTIFKEELLVSKMIGTANVSLTLGKIGDVPVPIVSPASQKRVDELMALCDELETAHGMRDEKRKRLNLASLKAVTDARTPEDFKMASGFFINHLPEITVTQDHIKNLRQLILNLAVRGKLTPQDPKDESGSELMKRIIAEKDRMLKTGEIKKIDKFAPVKAGEIPFSVPFGWQSIRMGWLAKKLGAGSTPLGGKSVYQKKGVPFLRSQNVYNDGLRIEDVALISVETHERMSGTHIQKNDILLNITGASIGRCALVPDKFTEGNVSQHVAIIRLFFPEIREFIHLSLISPFFQKVIDDVQVGVSREGLSMQSLRLFPMLLPPLAEQRRIVKRVDELMSLCDDLEKQISICSTQSTRLLNALRQGVSKSA